MKAKYLFRAATMFPTFHNKELEQKFHIFGEGKGKVSLCFN
jgi:hypothetical protein